MLTLNFKPFPQLSTKRLSLRELTLDDVEEIFELRSDPRVMKYIDRAPAKTIDEAMEWLKKIIKSQEENENIVWGMCIKGESKIIGTFCLWNIAKEHFRAEIGYSLRYDYHRKGFMHETMEEILKYGFNELKFHSFEANVNPENAASIKLLEKNNFVREAYFKENYYYDGKFLDSAIYSLLSSSS